MKPINIKHLLLLCFTNMSCKFTFSILECTLGCELNMKINQIAPNLTHIQHRKKLRGFTKCISYLCFKASIASLKHCLMRQWCFISEPEVSGQSEPSRYTTSQPTGKFIPFKHVLLKYLLKNYFQNAIITCITKRTKLIL